MTECQGCGAWNDTSRTLCVLCGTPLAETDEWDAAADLPPLPPLPDGGLSRSMPAWLRELPRLNPDGLPPAPPTAVVLEQSQPPEPLPPLGARADPRTFLTDDDFPRWLRDLAARTAPPPAPLSAAFGDGDGGPAALDRAIPPPWPAWPGSAAIRPQEPTSVGGVAIAEALPIERPDAVAEQPPVALQPPVLPPPHGLPPPAELVARVREDRRQRERWETLLLLLLFIGVIVAALWALIANGVLSPSL